jgi:N-sulfoglucosamine sulfohydrolase
VRLGGKTHGRPSLLHTAVRLLDNKQSTHMNQPIHILAPAVLATLTGLTGCQQKSPETVARPNILFCISDDQSFPHAGAYGCSWVKTPAFDRVAREGILFTSAYTPNAKCAPSRSSILTGRNSWQLEEAANHVPFFPVKFKTFPEVLKDNGYFTGFTGKGWAPGNPGEINGVRRQLTGQAFQEHKLTPPAKFISNNDYAANFEAFLDANTEGKPFSFWFGAAEPHRAYEYGAGVSKGDKSLTDIDRVFGFWPDNDTVRNDMLDYAFEIEYFDSQLGKMLSILEERGMLENTIVVVTSDNGMPFPRVKGNSYELSNHMPLAIMWPEGIKKPGRTVDGFISFIDFAPTFIELAGLLTDETGMQPVTGISMLPILKNEKGANGRDFMLLGRERTDMGRPGDAGYPVRSIIKDNYLYIRNYEPNRWPAGNPETGYMDADGSPTKTYILNERRIQGTSRLWNLNFGMRPGEELYDLSNDPDCIRNLAADLLQAPRIAEMSLLMEEELKKEGDPRMFGQGHIFDQYPYSEPERRNFHERFMAGEPVTAGWIEPTDIEKPGTFGL